MNKSLLTALAILTLTAMPAIAQTPPEAPIAVEVEAAEAKPFLNIQTVKTRSGLTAWLVEDHSLPIISIEFAFAGAGAAQDPSDLQGVARIMSNTMDEGAGEIDSATFQKTLQDKSIALSYGANRDDFTGSLKTLSRHQDTAFDLLKLSLTAPRFDAEPVSRMIASNEARIRSALAKPSWIAARIMNDTAFGDHPYAQNSGGSLSSLTRITPKDLRAYHAKAIAQDNLQISVVGDITAEALKQRLETVFGDLPKKSSLKSIKPAELNGQGEIALYKRDIPQTIIEITQPGIGRTSADYQTAQIMNFILGSSGFGSRLTKSVREDKGLTYGIYTSLNGMNNFNGLSLSTSTQNETAAEVLSLIKQEWQLLATQPITEAELEGAKSYLIGSVPLALTSTDKIAKMMLSLQLDDLPANYLRQREEKLEAVTIEDISALSSNLLNIDTMNIVLVGNPKDIEPNRIIENIPNAE